MTIVPAAEPMLVPVLWPLRDAMNQAMVVEDGDEDEDDEETAAVASASKMNKLRELPQAMLAVQSLILFTSKAGHPPQPERSQ